MKVKPRSDRHLNRPIIPSEIEVVIKYLPVKKVQGRLI